MNTQNITNGRIDWPNIENGLLFIHSPQPLRVRMTSSAFIGKTVQVTVISPSTVYVKAELVAESRYSSTSYAEFDISRLMQLAATKTPADIVKHADAEPIEASSQTFLVQVSIEGASGAFNRSFVGLPGAIGPGESWNAGKIHRRLFLNFPQTIMASGDDAITIDGYLVPVDTDADLAGMAMYEVNLLNALRAAALSGDAGAEAVLTKLTQGKSLAGAVMVPDIISEGTGSATPGTPVAAGVIFEPDNCARGEYFRWIRRDGTVGYWLFKVSKRSTTFAEKQSFREYVFDPYTPQEGSLLSELQSSRTEVQTMTVGDALLTDEEHDYVSGMAGSPFVQHFVPGAHGPHWEQVIVSPASVSKTGDGSTPSLHEIELTVQLPERNTIGL